MEDLPTEALTLISRARFLEKLIKEAMAETPERATLGELLRENTQLFDGLNERVQWAGRVRNGCAHVTNDRFSVIEIRKAIEILDAAIAEMRGSNIEVIENTDSHAYEPSAAPYFFSNEFYIKAIWFAALLAIAGVVLAKLVS